jgi:hypothetical protein
VLADIEVVYTNPSQPAKAPSVAQLQYARQLRADLRAFEGSADLVILDTRKADQRGKALRSKRQEAETRLDALGPLASCRQAAVAADDVFVERRMFASTQQPKRDTGMIVMAAKTYGESMDACRTDIERHEALMKAGKR